ncbi:sodium/solute symporter [Olivibacter sp. SDN3]|uniref:sodium:solute symporter family transporter n=1 Tax=Olivibacter sp. SDN3 TaxID=2764720 RepID=UPI0016513817|nr:sodium/solute symporter [Olivibacter sp. SDN3]QNL52266.1 sodium/solute symporter [Olivibacter sp. SDN3]
MSNIAERLTLLDYGIIGAYLILLMIIGLSSSLFNRNKVDKPLFLAHNSLGWASIGFNMWATNVGPSMLLAFASIGYTTGIVAVNFDWYAFVFLLLLALVFAPRYLGARVSTLPEFMGRRYGDTTRNILAWYSLVKMLISWLTLGLFAGGFLIRQVLGIPMWQSVTVLVFFAAFFTYMGGLKTIARINIFQMLLLIIVSCLLSILGIAKAGGLASVYHAVPADYWNLIHSARDPHYPWYAILLGYPVAAIAFFCTDQAMVQSVLGARSLEQGQLGVNFIAWLKILSLPLFILTGILCYVLYPELEDPSEAYMTMVTHLFPTGLNGLVIVVLIAVLVGTIGSSLNSLSTVFTVDIYVKKINPQASNRQMVKVGRYTILAGCIFAVLAALAIDEIKGLNLFDVFQSVLGFIAPPLSVVFLLTVFWKRTSRAAVNFVLSLGSVLSLGIGVLYLWVFTPDKFPIWPHYLMLSFCIFVLLMLFAVIISLFTGKREQLPNIPYIAVQPTNRVRWVWSLLIMVMFVLYIFFNGH